MSARALACVVGSAKRSLVPTQVANVQSCIALLNPGYLHATLPDLNVRFGDELCGFVQSVEIISEVLLNAGNRLTVVANKLEFIEHLLNPEEFPLRMSSWIQLR